MVTATTIPRRTTGRAPGTARLVPSAGAAWTRPLLLLGKG